MVSHSSPFAFPSLRAILSLQPQLQAALSLCPHCGRRLGRREWATAFNAQQPRAVLVTRSRMCFRAFLKASSRRMSRSRSKRRRYRVTGASLGHNFLFASILSVVLTAPHHIPFHRPRRDFILSSIASPLLAQREAPFPFSAPSSRKEASSSFRQIRTRTACGRARK